MLLAFLCESRVRVFTIFVILLTRFRVVLLRFLDVATELELWSVELTFSYLVFGLRRWALRRRWHNPKDRFLEGLY